MLFEVLCLYYMKIAAKWYCCFLRNLSHRLQEPRVQNSFQVLTWFDLAMWDTGFTISNHNQICPNLSYMHSSQSKTLPIHLF